MGQRQRKGVRQAAVKGPDRPPSRAVIIAARPTLPVPKTAIDWPGRRRNASSTDPAYCHPMPDQDPVMSFSSTHASRMAMSVAEAVRAARKCEPPVEINMMMSSVETANSSGLRFGGE